MESARLARGVRWRIALLVAATAAALAPLPPQAVERAYSSGLYPPLQRLLTSASNLTPFPAFDILILVVTAGFLAVTWRDLRSGGGAIRAAVRAVVRAAVVAAVAYLAFAVAWGFNYR